MRGPTRASPRPLRPIRHASTFTLCSCICNQIRFLWPRWQRCWSTRPPSESDVAGRAMTLMASSRRRSRRTTTRPIRASGVASMLVVLLCLVAMRINGLSRPRTCFGGAIRSHGGSRIANSVHLLLCPCAFPVALTCVIVDIYEAAVEAPVFAVLCRLPAVRCFPREIVGLVAQYSGHHCVNLCHPDC